MDLWSNGYQPVWEVNTPADVQIPASDIERNVDFGRVNFTPIAFYSLVGLHPDQQICALLRVYIHYSIYNTCKILLFLFKLC